MTYSSSTHSPHNFIDHFHHLKILKAPEKFSISLKFLRSCVPFTPSHGLTVQKLRHLAVQKFQRQKSNSLHFSALLYDATVQLDRKPKRQLEGF